MSVLAFNKITISAVKLNGESSLPPVADLHNIQQHSKSDLDEDDGLFLGYGFVNGAFPYRMQDMYDRELAATNFDSAILENKYLKATFIPSLGGRLWSLYDKIENKDLIFSNPVFRPGNLAVRNAWFSGGVEWNCGVIGHSPLTCSQLFTAAVTAEDGTEVLRMYEFERIRCAIYQIDFFLPEESKFLFCRMRVINPADEVVPMYWWSNMAVPEKKNARVVVSADKAYTSRKGVISKTDVPVSEGIDITYPVNNPSAIDYFWKIPENRRKYICHLDENGYGLIQTSTGLLQGRKLFVWGQGPGADRWEEFLSADGSGGRYAEIQAGLAHTQYECLPMPPKTAWEWMEAYGAMHADGSRVHGKWEDARAEVESRLTEMLPETQLDELLISTWKSFAKKPGKLIASGSGWGALENMRRKQMKEDLLPPYLDFGCVGEDQAPWVSLLENGFFPDMSSDIIPGSWMNQREWDEMMSKAVQGADRYNWFAYLQLGMTCLSQKRLAEAKKLLERSMELSNTFCAVYGLAQIASLSGDKETAAQYALHAAKKRLFDASVVKETFSLLYAAGMYSQMISLCSEIPDSISSLGRIRLLCAFAYLHIGDIEGAEILLYNDGGIIVADIREGENSVTDLWFQIEEQKARDKGENFNRSDAIPPAFLDFRMDAKKT